MKTQFKVLLVSGFLSLIHACGNAEDSQINSNKYLSKNEKEKIKCKTTEDEYIEDKDVSKEPSTEGSHKEKSEDIKYSNVYPRDTYQKYDEKHPNSVGLVALNTDKTDYETAIKEESKSPKEKSNHEKDEEVKQDKIVKDGKGKSKPETQDICTTLKKEKGKYEEGGKVPYQKEIEDKGRAKEGKVNEVKEDQVPENIDQPI